MNNVSNEGSPQRFDSFAGKLRLLRELSFRAINTEHIIITENFRVIETRHGISECNANVSFRDEAHFYRRNIATAGIGGARHLG